MANDVSRNERIADLADVVLNLAREIRSRDAEAEALSLTVTEGNVMRYVDQHPGATPTELARGTGLQRTNLSATLRTLEVKGLVDRIHDPDDGRTVRVDPTQRAGENLRLLRAHWSDLLGDALTDAPDSRLDSAVNLLIQIEEGLVRSRLLG